MYIVYNRCSILDHLYKQKQFIAGSFSIKILSCSISLASLKLFYSNSLSDSQFGGNTSSNSYRTQGKESGFSPS